MGENRDFQSAYDFGRVAQELIEHEGCPQEGKAATIKVKHLVLNYIKHPVFNSLEPAIHAYRLAKEIGDVCLAANCLQMHGMIGAVVGKPLQDLEKEIMGYCNCCRDFKGTLA